MKVVVYIAFATALVTGCKKRPERLVPEAEIRSLRGHAMKFLSTANTGAWLRTPDHGACTNAVRQARSQSAKDGIATLVAALRTTQTRVQRGSLIVAADMMNGCKLLIDALSARLASAELSPTDLGSARSALSALIKGYPDARVLVRDELYMTLLDQVMPALQPPGWKPPKGWPGGKPPRTDGDGDDAVLHVFKYERDLYGLRWLAIRAELGAADEACGHAATLQQCADGLRRMANAHEAHVEQIGQEDLREVVRASGKTEVVRANAIDSLRGTMRPDYETSLRDLAAGLDRLKALRSKVAARLQAPHR